MFLGNYTGGELLLEDGRVFSEPGVWHRYDGGRLMHWNNPITSGEKYNVIAHCRAEPYNMYTARRPQDDAQDDPTMIR